MRSISKEQFDRSSRQLASVLFAVLAFVSLLLIGGVAFAQDTASSEPVIHVRPTSVMGWVLTILFGLLMSALGWLVVRGAALLGEKAKASKIFALLNMLGVKAVAVGGKVVAKLRPMIEKDLADGTITKEEWDELLAEAVKTFYEVAGEELKKIGPVLNVFGDSATKSFVEGLVGNGLRKVISQLAPGATIPDPAADAAPTTP